MRARNLKPAFFKNEDLAELPFEYRLLFQGLWCLADKAGRLEDRPKRIGVEVFPYDAVDIEDGLNALSKLGLIVRYEVDRHKCIYIPSFLSHNHPHKKEKDSELPELPEQALKLLGRTGTVRVITATDPAESPLLNDESPSPPIEARTAATADEWARLESSLTANGVRELEAVRAGLKCSVGHALAAVKHYASKPGAWNPGQLVTRLKNLRDSQDPADDALWLPVSAEYAKRQKRDAAPKAVAGPDPGVESAKRLADLESRYGKELNAMTDVDRDALAVGLNGPMAKMYRTSGWKSVRSMLLELMRARDGPGPRPATVKVHSPPPGDSNGEMAKRKGGRESKTESVGVLP